MEYPKWLTQYEPQLPLNSLIEEVNNLYHSFDAALYDDEHPEIHQQLPEIWDQMIATLPQKVAWRVLDFGCGTGFEADQVLRSLGSCVSNLVAFDPSPHMLKRCRARLSQFDQVTLCSHFDDLPRQGPFNLLITNSLLHHLPNVHQTSKSLLPMLTPDAMWLAGHEPSSRFYKNSSCVQFFEEYSQHRRWRKFLEPSSYIAKIRLLWGNAPGRLTARAAFQRGLFKKTPSISAIDRIVDFHVAHSSAEVAEGRGLDFERMQEKFGEDWHLKWTKTYSFFGPFKPTNVQGVWVAKANRIAEAFPHDGANFSAVWSR